MRVIDGLVGLLVTISTTPLGIALPYLPIDTTSTSPTATDSAVANSGAIIGASSAIRYSSNPPLSNTSTSNPPYPFQQGDQQQLNRRGRTRKLKIGKKEIVYKTVLKTAEKPSKEAVKRVSKTTEKPVKNTVKNLIEKTALKKLESNVQVGYLELLSDADEGDRDQSSRRPAALNPKVTGYILILEHPMDPRPFLKEYDQPEYIRLPKDLVLNHSRTIWRILQQKESGTLRGRDRDIVYDPIHHGEKSLEDEVIYFNGLLDSSFAKSSKTFKKLTDVYSTRRELENYMWDIMRGWADFIRDKTYPDIPSFRIEEIENMSKFLGRVKADVLIFEVARIAWEKKRKLMKEMREMREKRSLA